MRRWSAERVADAAGARVVETPKGALSESGPRRATVDSRGVRPGDLFVGLRGRHADGGAHAADALRAGAWGVLVTHERAQSLCAGAADPGTAGVVLAHHDPLQGLQALALAWRRELRAGGTRVVAITGSTGKTSTKDILAASLSSPTSTAATGLRTAASPENFNTEIGLPLALLGAPGDTEVLVLELAMRGPGQIAQLTAMAEPDVGVIVNVGPAHLELLGTLEAIAAAKAELIAGLLPGATAVLPAEEPLLAPYRRADLRTVTFGDGGDVELVQAPAGRDPRVRSATRGAPGRAQGRPGEVIIHDRRRSEAPDGAGRRDRRIALEPSFAQAHNLQNLLAAVAAALALGVTPEGRLEVRFSALRGQRIELPGGVVLIDDCYNANPMSMRAAIDDLAETATARRVAVLGDMLELGPGAGRLHREIGEHAGARGVELLVAVGPLAAEMRDGFAGEAHCVPDAEAAVELLQALLRDGDTVLVKGSRAVGLERVAEGLSARTQSAAGGAARGVAEETYAGPRRR